MNCTIIIHQTPPDFCTTAERVYFIYLGTCSCYKGRWLPADVIANGTGHQHQKATSSSAIILILTSYFPQVTSPDRGRLKYVSVSSTMNA